MGNNNQESAAARSEVDGTGQVMTDAGGRLEAPGPKILYIDPWTGISGDMMLGALLDTDRNGQRLEGVMRQVVAALGLRNESVKILRDVERGLACTRVRVHEKDAAPLRHLKQVESIIEDSGLSDGVRERSSGAIRHLAAVEASIHGCGVEEIHFHEVGAVDTLVDVVGAFALVEALGVEQVSVGPIQVGGGTIEIAHGRLGVPAPATARLLAGYPVTGGPEMRELTTPTGALLVRELGAVPGPLPAMVFDEVGYGGGSMQLDCGPNVLRIVAGRGVSPTEGPADAHSDVVVELQTNVDNVSPEIVGHTCLLLREAGALDVWSCPIVAKKDRPGMVLHVLAPPELEEIVAGIIFAETGTLGIRRQTKERRIASRGSVGVQVEGVELRVKWGRWRGRLVSVAPEYDDAVSAARDTGLPLIEVMRVARESALKILAPDHLLP